MTETCRSSADCDLFALVANLPVPLLVHDLAEPAAIRFMNPAFTEAFGYGLAEAPTLAVWAERAYPDPAARARAGAAWWSAIAARRATGKATPPAEYRFVDSAGNPRDAMVGFALQGDLAVVSVQDLTGVRAAEAALETERRKAEQTAHALTENMPAGAYTMLLRPGAALAEFAFVSRRFLEMLDLTRDEALGNPMTGFSRVHPEDRSRWLEMNAAAFARKAPFSGEARILVRGETRWIRAESVPRDLEDGSTLWEGFLVDTTALKSAEQRLLSVIEAAQAYTWRRELPHGRLEFDAAWASPRGHAPGQWDMDFDAWLAEVHPDDLERARATIDAVAAGAVAQQTMVYRRRIRDGQWIWLRLHAGVCARDTDGRPTVMSGVSFDITAEMAERERAQESQARLREDLQRAQQRDTVAQVAGGLAHDLNNLIAVIAGTAEMLEHQVGHEPRLCEGLARIGRSVTMARDLVSGLGGLMKRDRPRGPHDLGGLLRDGIDLLGSRRIARHAVRVLTPQAPLEIWADPTEVAQVIVNLAINACDSGGEELPARVTLTAHPAGTAPPRHRPDVGSLPPAGTPVAVFTVADTGAGIPDEVRARMFRPNFTTKGAAGTGLGLLIVSTILHDNRAALWVETAPGAGTTMTVAWPATGPGPQAAALSAPGGGTAAPAGGGVPARLLEGLSVLVVDDQADVGDVLADMLEAAGAVAIAESDPLEARRSLIEIPETWSVLVTDLHMPGLDGRALARVASALSPPVPVVLVTARPEALGDAASDGFAAVLSKPVTGAELARAVQAAARHRGG